MVTKTDKELMEVIRQNLLLMMRQAGYEWTPRSMDSVHTLADKCCLSFDTIRKIITDTNHSIPRLKTLNALARGLGTTPEHFLVAPVNTDTRIESLNEDDKRLCLSMLELLVGEGSTVSPPEPLGPVLQSMRSIGLVYDIVVNGKTYFAPTDFGLSFFLENKI